ncbi:hypothetical protein C9374_003102 [Naegleria lovaniensis]|uniref:DnaJ homolog subfamily C member 2 n=1 Tax=Naegleria lovaniensis TaxID=51637 RepID=A0AA88GTF5_NAELO|nr:uncharacterized protein C9374_003102 [Naegleria lovaniensis]KAG2385953.1 hypothetical protein C9374_003102 [Naegleria lovaniensis]
MQDSQQTTTTNINNEIQPRFQDSLSMAKVEQYIGRGFFQMLFQEQHDVNNKYSKASSKQQQANDDDEDEDDDEEINAGVDVQKLMKKKRIIKNSEGYEKEEEDYDYYEVLGLEKRWLSTPDDIRKAYKKKVKEYHPDHFKKASSSNAETSQVPDDTMFKVLTKAYETLLDEKKKLAYDSSEPFDDSIPTYPTPSTPITEEEEQKRFFSTFAPVFERWSKWSRVFPNVPKLGGMKTPWEEVERFYTFWATFKSWRDFSGESEYDESMADSREERRWMKRQNDKLNQKRKKEEKKKLTDLVELARRNDPRVKKKNEEIEQERKRKEEERAKRELEKFLKEEQERKDEEERQRKAEQEERERKQREKEENERKQQEKIQTIKKMRDMCEPYLVLILKLSKNQDQQPTKIKAEDLEFLLSNLPIDNLMKAVQKLEPIYEESQKSKDDSIFVKAFYEIENKVREIVRKKEEEKKQLHAQQKKNAEKKSSEWTHEELTLLAKAIALYPGGTQQRWVRVAEYVGTKTPEEVQQKTGEIRKKSSTGEVIPKRDEKDYFGEFQKANAKNQTSKKKEEEQKKMEEQYVIGSKTNQPSSTESSSTTSIENWTALQQKALETGIRQYKELKGDAKWEKISEIVPGKSAQDCKDRFEYCRQLALAKKSKQ